MVSTQIREDMFAKFNYNGTQRVVVFVENENDFDPIRAWDFVKNGYRCFCKENMENFSVVRGYIEKTPEDKGLRGTTNVYVKYLPERKKLYATKQVW